MKSFTIFLFVALCVAYISEAHSDDSSSKGKKLGKPEKSEVSLHVLLVKVLSY